MKTADYNFKFIDSQPLKEFMKDKQVQNMFLHEEADGVRYAIGNMKNGRYVVIPLASTISGLHLDLNVCWVKNPKHKSHPREFVLLCNNTFADVDDSKLSDSVSVTLKNYGK